MNRESEALSNKKEKNLLIIQFIFNRQQKTPLYFDKLIKRKSGILKSFTIVMLFIEACRSTIYCRKSFINKQLKQIDKLP